MDWKPIEHRLALLELMSLNVLTKRVRQAKVYDWLSELKWTQRTKKRDQIKLLDEPKIITLLNNVWKEWHEEYLQLLECGFPPTPTGWRKYKDDRRALMIKRDLTTKQLPTHLSKHTASAITAPTAKSELTKTRRSLLSEQKITNDGLVRIRPPKGFIARQKTEFLELDPIITIFDEVGISDRALQNGLILEGTLRAVVLVENLGAWRDMVRPSGCLLAYIPGWNTALVSALLAALPKSRVFHFGDLDPNGVRIHQHLKKNTLSLEWLIPPFWEELIDEYAQKRDWPSDLSDEKMPYLVRKLAATGRWMEQERVAIDPRLESYLVEKLASGPMNEIKMLH